MNRAFFVTGTDTGVGKTLVTCALLHATRWLGLTAVGMKPIAAGIEADGCNDDVVQLLAASSVHAPAGMGESLSVRPAHRAAYRRRRSGPAYRY